MILTMAKSERFKGIIIISIVSFGLIGLGENYNMINSGVWGEN